MLEHPFALPFLGAAFGSIIQEFLYWHHLRTKLHLKTHQRLLKSTGYWAVVFLMALISGVGVVIWFYESIEDLSGKDFLIMGAAFPALFKLGVSAASSRRSVTLGTKEASTLKAYFLAEE